MQWNCTLSNLPHLSTLPPPPLLRKKTRVREKKKQILPLANIPGQPGLVGIMQVQTLCIVQTGYSRNRSNIVLTEKKDPAPRCLCCSRGCEYFRNCFSSVFLLHVAWRGCNYPGDCDFCWKLETRLGAAKLFINVGLVSGRMHPGGCWFRAWLASKIKTNCDGTGKPPWDYVSINLFFLILKVRKHTPLWRAHYLNSVFSGCVRSYMLPTYIFAYSYQNDAVWCSGGGGR